MSVSKTQSAGMLEREGGLRDEDEAEAGVWKGWFTSLEEEEEIIEGVADEERTSVDMSGG